MAEEKNAELRTRPTQSARIAELAGSRPRTISIIAVALALGENGFNADQMAACRSLLAMIYLFGNGMSLSDF